MILKVEIVLLTLELKSRHRSIPISHITWLCLGDPTIKTRINVGWLIIGLNNIYKLIYLLLSSDSNTYKDL